MEVKRPTPPEAITGVVNATRVTEHQRSVRNWDKNNAIACHVTVTKHSIKWEESEVLAREPN